MVSSSNWNFELELELTTVHCSLATVHFLLFTFCYSMSFIRGALRFAIALPAIALAALVIIPVSWLPLRVQRISLAAWLCTLVARLAMRVFNVRFRCDAPDKLRQHHGLVFPNHISFFDILMMLHVVPMRFLSAIETRRMLFIGQVAAAIGTVFVDRSNKTSRAEARAQLARVSRFPPIVLYPEGGTGPARALQPFRFGAFEIAIEHQIPYLPCAIVYSHPAVIEWGHGESFLQALWRLACFAGPIEARLAPLEVVQPRPTDDPQQLAVAAHRAIAAVLNVSPQM